MNTTFKCPKCRAVNQYNPSLIACSGCGWMHKRNSQSKYNAVAIEIDGKRFDSKGEAKRYQELYHLQQARQISHLKRQPVFRIEIYGSLICKYKADFAYYNSENELVIEDFKGMKTPVYNLKHRLMKEVLGLDIVEVTR